MAKFRKKRSQDSQSINTSSLPDIVFMLLFFFMVATKMRDKEVMVRTGTPVASEVEQVVKKSWVNYILVGPPLNAERDGTAPRIQLDDHYGKIEDVGPFVILKISEQPEQIQPYLTTSIKADKSVRMGMITDIKQELRKANALKLLYSATEGQVQGE